jgi:hypothetical protein
MNFSLFGLLAFLLIGGIAPLSALAEQKTEVTPKDQRDYFDSCGTYVGIKNGHLCPGSPASQLCSQGISQYCTDIEPKDTSRDRKQDDDKRDQNK